MSTPDPELLQLFAEDATEVADLLDSAGALASAEPTTCEQLLSKALKLLRDNANEASLPGWVLLADAVPAMRATLDVASQQSWLGSIAAQLRQPPLQPEQARSFDQLAALLLAPPQTVITPADETFTDPSMELQGLLLEEVKEIQEALSAQLAADHQLDRIETRRLFHTIRGGAAMAKLADFAQFNADLERWMDNEPPGDQLKPTLLQASHWLEKFVSRWPEPETEALRWAGNLNGADSSQGRDNADQSAPLAEANTGNSNQSVTVIFVQEVEEIFELLHQHLAKNQLDMPALEDMRRGFHTLKGSGRTVGANTLATFAEQVERLLNSYLKDQNSALEKLPPLLTKSLQHAENLLTDWLQGTELQQAIEALSPKPVVTSVDAVFQEEARELLDQCDQLIQGWQGDWQKLNDDSGELMRQLHTLKGGARMVGLQEVGSVSHALETLIGQLQNQSAAIDTEQQALVQRGFDCLHETLDRLAQQMDVDVQPVLTVLNGAIETDGQPHPDTATTTDSPPIAPANNPEANSPQWIRLSLKQLDTMLNDAGELSISRSRLSQNLRSFRLNLSELSDTVKRLQGQLRELQIEAEKQIHHRMEQDQLHGEFDPLELDRYSAVQELSRTLGESVNDLGSIDEFMDRLLSSSETVLVSQERSNLSLQETLMGARLVPFSTTAQRIERLVRQLAAETQRPANIEISGRDAMVDRTILDKISAPLEHLVRNALVHGLESPEERSRINKPAHGLLRMAVRREGNRLKISLIDDGRGLDLMALRARAVARGLLKRSEDHSREQLINLIFAPGLSTAATLTQLAGRGVGMDVVRNNVAALGGTLTVSTETNVGTRFGLDLPFRLSLSRSLLVRLQNERFAVSLDALQGVARANRRQLQAAYDGKPFEYAGQQYRVNYLGDLLGMQLQRPLPRSGKTLPVLLLRGRQHSEALVVDQTLESRDLVVKSVGPYLSKLPGVSGGSILGDGSVILIIDPINLLQREVASVSQMRQPQNINTKIMVVDDSITVRRITSRVLENRGWQIITARDGLDALTRLQDERPDLFLLDIEMPKMDGFELAMHIRSDQQYKQTPIIMITSRMGDKHRQRAASLGVNEFLGKPYQEQQLLDLVSGLLAQ